MADLPDATRLRQLAAIVRHRSFAKAAEVLGITQPALSRNVKALERELGVKLLERGRFGAIPTQFGQALARRSDAVDAELRIAGEEIRALRNGRAGGVAIGCGPAEATRLLPLALERMHAQSPNIKVTVLYGLNAALVPMVAHGDVDFALSSIPTGGRGSELKQIFLHEDRGIVVASAQHKLASRGRPVALADTLSERWVLARPEELERRAIDEAFVAHNLEPPVPDIETTSAFLMKTLVQENGFLSYFPRELVCRELDAGVLTNLRIPGVDWRRLVGVTLRSRSALSPAAEAALSSLRSVAKSFGDHI